MKGLSLSGRKGIIPEIKSMDSIWKLVNIVKVSIIISEIVITYLICMWGEVVQMSNRWRALRFSKQRLQLDGRHPKKYRENLYIRPAVSGSFWLEWSPSLMLACVPFSFRHTSGNGYFLFVTSFPLFSPVRRWKCCTIGPNVMNLELPHLTLKNSLTALNKRIIELTCHAASSDNSTEPMGWSFNYVAFFGHYFN